MSWNPDGTALVSASADRDLRIWRLNEALWIEQARRVVNRNLTLAEWRSVLGGDEGYQAAFPDLPVREEARP